MTPKTFYQAAKTTAKEALYAFGTLGLAFGAMYLIDKASSGPVNYTNSPVVHETTLNPSLENIFSQEIKEAKKQIKKIKVNYNVNALKDKYKF